MAARAKIQVIGLAVKPDSPAAGEAAAALAKWLAGRGVRVEIDVEAARWIAGVGHEREALAERVDLLVVLGGDGTLLAAAREIGARRIPILGVNLGTVGFLAEVNPEEQYDVLGRVLSGEMGTVERMRLEVRVERAGEERGRFLALNDAVITRGHLSRMIDLETLADGDPVATYRGDGLIVATPTGSTAYSLSAGGPILLPGLAAFVLTPISPHTLSQRPLVLPETSGIEIRAFPREGLGQLTVDGQVGLALDAGDRVLVRRGDEPAVFVASPYRSRFDILRTKLGWGAG
jgi:NAD+ kinase